MEESLSRGFCMKTSCRSGPGGGTKCGRWNPTTEQVKVLTDLFSSGLRTPTTDQIQKISSQLSLYGKIESKNVFYWFQNHKARERHKRRKVSSVVDKANNNATTIISSPRSFAEIYHNQRKEKVSDHRERLIETLQLFPLNSFGDELCKDKAAFQYSDQVRDHPPLDLRLSFV